MRHPLPTDQLWRLMIDGNRQSTVGPMGFDVEEPGYLKGMCHGWNFVLETASSELSLEYLVRLHDICVKSVSNIQKYTAELDDKKNPVIREFRQPFESGLNEGSVSFGLIPSSKSTNNYTVSGLRAILERLAQGESAFYITVLPFSMENRITSARVSLPISDVLVREVFDSLENHSGQIDYDYRTAKTVARTVNDIILKYSAAIEIARDDQEKIRAIATCVQELEFTHPFPDGNCRTLVLLLLNKLLLSAGLPFTILENPNRFDGYSIDELCHEITTGFEVYTRYAQGKDRSCVDKTVLYLSGNRMLAQLVASESVIGISQWDQVNPNEQTSAIKKLTDFLLRSTQDGYTYTDLIAIKQKMQEAVIDCIYKKSWYQINFTFSSNTYGVRVEELETLLETKARPSAIHHP